MQPADFGNVGSCLKKFKAKILGLQGTQSLIGTGADDNRKNWTNRKKITFSNVIFIIVLL